MKNQIERAEPSRLALDAHPCPKCGYEMCQQFDDKPGPNEMVTLAVPNGKYICYRHPAPGEPDCKCNCNPHCGCECHGHVVLLEALRRAKQEMMGLAAYLETCDADVIVDSLTDLAKALNVKVDEIGAVIQAAEGR